MGHGQFFTVSILWGQSWFLRLRPDPRKLYIWAKIHTLKNLLITHFLRAYGRPLRDDWQDLPNFENTRGCRQWTLLWTCPRKSWKSSSSDLWMLLGHLLINSKDITMNLNCLYQVQKVILEISFSLIFNWWYHDLKSILKKYLAQWSRKSLIHNNGYLFLIVTLLSWW